MHIKVHYGGSPAPSHLELEVDSYPERGELVGRQKARIRGPIRSNVEYRVPGVTSVYFAMYVGVLNLQKAQCQARRLIT